MPLYGLPEYIHFCTIGGQRLFLDLAGDRYFMLPADADRSFGALMDDSVPRPPAADIDFLASSGVLVANGRPVAPTRHPRATASLIEKARGESTFSMRTILETWVLVRRARRAIARKTLPALLHRLTEDRPVEGVSPGMARDKALASFRSARRFVPIAPNCLSDSLALCRFLRRRGIAADLVIGAKLHPFGAHCWLQQGTIVLNDSLAAAREFEPVLVA